jgi:hypothetical protein
MRMVADSLNSFKMRYGFQFWQYVRTREDQPKSKGMKLLQRAQNRMLRMLTGTCLADRIRIKDLLEMTNSFSVNQTAAQIKLGEMWKAAMQPKYPVKMERVERNANEHTRQSKSLRFKVKGRTKVGRSAFVADGARPWNNAPGNITSATTIWQAKKSIRTYCKTLPI